MIEHCDITLIGVGLSGARVLTNLADILHHHGAPRLPVRVIAFDKAGQFARGVPYGVHSDRRALLIETLEQTRCPELTAWIRSRPHELHRLAESADPDDRAWWVHNRTAVEAGSYQDLFLPRHLFGEFSWQVFDEAMDHARRAGLMDTQLRVEEVKSLHPTLSGGYRIETRGAVVESRLVLLAVGSIPRTDQFLPEGGDTLDYRYVRDDVYCGSFQLREAFTRYVSREPEGPVRLAIIGAGASAIESLYCAMNHPGLSERIESAVTLSGSGMLPGGIRSPDASPAPISPWALSRTSAAAYVETARALISANRLRTVSARVMAVTPREQRLLIDVALQPAGTRTVIEADLVINCSGAGDLRASSSELLRSLSTRLTVIEGGRGFKLSDDYSLSEMPRVFVAGPLLNRNDLGGHVESITAVFRVGQAVASSLHKRLKAMALPGVASAEVIGA